MEEYLNYIMGWPIGWPGDLIVCPDFPLLPSRLLNQRDKTLRELGVKKIRERPRINSRKFFEGELQSILIGYSEKF